MSNSAFASIASCIRDRFALIQLGGKIGVIDRKQAAEVSTLRPLQVYSRIDGNLLIRRFAKDISAEADAAKEANNWFMDPLTTQLSGIELNPRMTIPGHLNLWRGLAVTPRKGSYRLIRHFIWSVICNRNHSVFKYVWRWLAHMAQRPWEKPGVSILLRGGQGIGKGTFAVKLVGALYQHHFLHLQTDAALTGAHNDALEASFLIFADEAFFSGDKKAASALKVIETEDRLHINPKYQPGRQIVSYHRIISASNNHHAADVDRDDRRKLALRVSEEFKGDYRYWAALDAEIRNGGLEAFAFALKATNLDKFQVRDKPNTTELVKQKLASLGPIARWWVDRLSAGQQTDLLTSWQPFVPSCSMHDDYLEHRKGGGQRGRPETLPDFREQLRKYCPSASPAQQGPADSRKRGLTFQSLQIARAEFEHFIGGTVAWD